MTHRLKNALPAALVAILAVWQITSAIPRHDNIRICLGVVVFACAIWSIVRRLRAEL